MAQYTEYGARGVVAAEHSHGYAARGVGVRRLLGQYPLDTVAREDTQEPDYDNHENND